MPYCSRCGVEVEPNKKKCPLCDTKIQELGEEEQDYTSKYPEEVVEEERLPQRTSKQRRIISFEVISIILVMPLLITLSTNLIINKTVTWAWYPISSLILAWFLVSFPLIFPKKPYIIVPGEVIPLTLFLLVMDYLDNQHLDWYLTLALPTLALTLVIVTAVVLGSIKAKNKGLNTAAFVLFAISGICLGLDVIISSYILGRFYMFWSLFVITPGVLIGGFLLYLHYRIIRKTDLKRKIQT
jgi:hypothetical protein